MKRIILLTGIVGVALPQITARDSAAKAESPDNAAPARKETAETKDPIAPRLGE